LLLSGIVNPVNKEKPYLPGEKPGRINKIAV
jgi:hypothetical protein